MYSEIVIQPEHDVGFAYSDPPKLPLGITPGVGSVDDGGRPMRTFMAATERECWRVAFAASEWRDRESFKACLQRNNCAPHRWEIVCPGRTAPAHLFIAVVRSELLSPRHRTTI
ncbi:MAG: hypothetical protein ABL871_03830 [Terricaulis sp.]